MIVYTLIAFLGEEKGKVILLGMIISCNLEIKSQMCCLLYFIDESSWRRGRNQDHKIPQ